VALRLAHLASTLLAGYSAQLRVECEILLAMLSKTAASESHAIWQVGGMRAPRGPSPPPPSPAHARARIAPTHARAFHPPTHPPNHAALRTRPSRAPQRALRTRPP